MSKKTLTTLRGKISIKHGFAFKGEYFTSEGKYIILTPGNFKEEGGFKFDLGKAKFYQGEIPSDYICKKGDLIVAMTEQAEGLLGSMAIVPDDDKFLHNQRIGLINVNENAVDKVFLYHLFNTKSVRHQVRLSSSGSKVKHTSPDRLYDVTVRIPDFLTQQKIANVLSALNAKIALNNRINAELEAMAKTLYDYWFVQFDFPNEENKPYKTSGGAMVWNEDLKREIPEGWEILELKKFANTASGGTPLSTNKDFYENGNIAWINSGELNNPYIVKGNNYITEKGLKNSSAKVFPVKTLLVAMYGATAGKVSILLTPACTNQAICAIIPKSEILTNYLKFALSDLYQYLINLSSGSARDNLSQDKIKDLKFVIPNIQLLEKFDKILNPIVQKVSINIEQNQQLSALRDWLLPMLMNGQVVVGEK